MHSHNEHPDHPRFEHLSYPADWEAYGKAAGPIRNQRMLDEGKPDLVIAFSDLPTTSGTYDMIKRAKAAGIPVYLVSRP
jgi:DNA-binding MurR/RpiR family transcriptional regulator